MPNSPRTPARRVNFRTRTAANRRSPSPIRRSPSPRTPSRVVYSLTRQNAIRPRNHPRRSPPSPIRRSPVGRQPWFHNINVQKNTASTKILAALRGFLARKKHLPNNKFLGVINPNGTILVGIKPTRLGASAAKASANMKQYNRYMARLRGFQRNTRP